MGKNFKTKNMQKIQKRITPKMHHVVAMMHQGCKLFQCNVIGKGSVHLEATGGEQLNVTTAIFNDLVKVGFIKRSGQAQENCCRYSVLTDLAQTYLATPERHHTFFPIVKFY